MQIPLSYDAKDTAYDTLTAVYNSEPVAITLLHGNQSIDDVVQAINNQLSDGFVMTYDDNTNKVAFSTDSPAPDNVLSFASDKHGVVVDRSDNIQRGGGRGPGVRRHGEPRGPAGAIREV